MAKTIDVRCDKSGVIFDVSTKRIFVEDVKTLTNGQIAVLECGDFVVKQTGNQKHTYKVTYKEENVGLCITYEDATLIETVSYDWNGEKWVYNSTDTANIEGGGGTTVVANPTLSGGEADLTGLQVGNTKYKTKKYYKHSFYLSFFGHNNCTLGFKMITANPNAYTTSNVRQLLDDAFLYNAKIDVFEDNTGNKYVTIFDEYIDDQTNDLHLTGIGFDEDNLFVKGNIILDLAEVDGIEYLEEIVEV